jgi:hypothetical protein
LERRRLGKEVTSASAGVLTGPVQHDDGIAPLSSSLLIGRSLPLLLGGTLACSSRAP